MYRWIVLTIMFSGLGIASGQPAPAPAPTAVPQAPTLEPISPLGLAPGQVVDLVLSGKNLADPVHIVASFPLSYEFALEPKPERLTVKLTVGADAPVGLHLLQLITKRGISNARPICVDGLPTVPEKAGNTSIPSAQEVPLPGVVDGHVDAEKSHYFRFAVDAGQRLSFDCLARRIGSPLDPVIALYHADGREVPGIYSDDEPGLQGDARLTYTFAEAGEYAIEVRDATHKGGKGHTYRLRIGDFPCVITPFPIALQRGTSADVTFVGPLVEQTNRITVNADVNGPPALSITPNEDAWPVELELSDVPEITETEPNNDAASANELPVPGGVSGRFLEKGDVDVYRFTAKKGSKYTITGRTYEIRSPAEVYIVVKDANGKQLAATKPGEDPKIDFTAPSDGNFFLYVEHLNFGFGPNEVYHVRITAGEPDFTVILGQNRVSVPLDGVGVLSVQSVSRTGYGGPIELTLEGIEGVEGTVTIPAGRSSVANAPVTLMPLQVTGEVSPGGGPIRVRAVGKVGDQEIVRYARLADSTLSSMLSGLPVPPRSLAEPIALGITEKESFSLTPASETLEFVRGKPAKVNLKAHRDGFDDAIALQAVGVPPNTTIKFKNIDKGSSEVEITIETNANTPVGPHAITFRGSAKVTGQDRAVYASPLTLIIKEK